MGDALAGPGSIPTDATDSRLIAEIAEWIESRRSALADAAPAHSIPDFIQTATNEVTAMDASTISHGVVIGQSSPTVDGRFANALFERAGRVLDDRGQQLIDFLCARFGDSLRWPWWANWVAREEVHRSLPGPHNWTDPQPALS